MLTCSLCGFESINAKPPNTCINIDGPCQTCIAIAKVDEKIDQAVATLRRLIAKRRDLCLEQNRTHDPLHRLPVELRNYIFELLLPRRDEWGGLVRVGRRGRAIMPTYLTSICRSWRDTAWSNPSLWSIVDLVIGKRAATPSRLNFVRDWIVRSGTLPLTLHIVVYNKDSEGELTDVLEVISQCSSRWHSLSLDIPSDLLPAFHHSNLQYHHIKRLRISTSPNVIDQPMPLLNPKVSPEKIEIYGISFQSLRISWNHLTSAKVDGFDEADITQLFRHASQMTYCQILFPSFRDRNFTMGPIVHQSLTVLNLLYATEAAASLLGCLTLPSLQEFHANELLLLTPANLPALVDRSSCPLTRITLGVESVLILDIQPLTGVTDLVLETIGIGCAVATEQLLGEYFPDLLHLTLRLQPFLHLWDRGMIPQLLNRKRPRPGAQNKGRLDRLLVVDQDQRRASEFNAMLDSKVGRQLKALGIRLREGGFEFL